MNGNLDVQPQNNLQGGGNQFDIFNYKNLGQVRVVRRNDGEPLFCLNDVCAILGIKNQTDVKNRLSVEGVDLIYLGVQTGVFPDGSPIMQNVEMTFIDQGNLYMAIGRSRKPEAQNFMNWVYREVLPSIANKGYYTMPQMTEMQMINKISATMIDYANRLDDHDTQLKVVNSTLEQFNNQIEILSHEGYFTIATHAKFRNIPVSLETAQTLGTIATKICEERGIGVASIPHPTFNFIHAYPYEILNEVFSNYFSN